MRNKAISAKMSTGYLFAALMFTVGGTALLVNTAAVAQTAAAAKTTETKTTDASAEAQEPQEKWTKAIAEKETRITSENDSAAAQGATENIQKVSKNIQQLKQQVIDLNKDLRLMEEKLLFPSSTKYSVFVSMSSGQFFALESIKLKIDGKLVATHLYSEKQRQAMIRGGIHKLYITNLNEGKHSATIFFTGVGPNERPYKRASTIDFEKGPAGEYLEIAISDDSVTQEPVFGIKQW
jgi:hypothetical protein